jgi:hypothetical protein
MSGLSSKITDVECLVLPGGYPFVLVQATKQTPIGWVSSSSGVPTRLSHQSSPTWRSPAS